VYFCCRYVVKRNFRADKAVAVKLDKRGLSTNPSFQILVIINSILLK